MTIFLLLQLLHQIPLLLQFQIQLFPETLVGFQQYILALLDVTFHLCVYTMLPLQFVNTVDKLVRQLSTLPTSQSILRIQFLRFSKFGTERLNGIFHLVSHDGGLGLRRTHEFFLRFDNRPVCTLLTFVSSLLPTLLLLI